jgi:hypothetical protein
MAGSMGVEQIVAISVIKSMRYGGHLGCNGALWSEWEAKSNRDHIMARADDCCQIVAHVLLDFS